MGYYKNLEITKESEFVPEQEKTTMEPHDIYSANALHTLLNIAYKAMHENANLGTEEGLEEAEKIRDAIFEVKAADFPQAVRSWRTYERREERRKARN